MSYLGGFIGPNMTTVGLGGSVGAGTSLSGLGGQLGSGVNTNISPIAAWAINEGAGNTFIERVSGNNAVATGTSWATGRTPFTGSVNDFSLATVGGVVPYVPALDINGPLTYSLWLSTDSSAFAGAIYSNLTANAQLTGVQAYVNAFANTVDVYFIHDNTVTNQIDIQFPASLLATTGAYTNLIVTYDGSSHAAGVNIYLNGSLISTTVISDALVGSIANGTTGLVLGQTPTAGANTLWGGVLKDVRVYNAVMSSTQVAATYAAGPIT